ncbi:hypothetical protein HDU97_007351 [Phlyctochytrium planicorne]|nr:hypothetical protein HDU97_007351 [Phlyctochytrium planicorne]
MEGNSGVYLTSPSSRFEDDDDIETVLPSSSEASNQATPLLSPGYGQLASMKPSGSFGDLLFFNKQNRSARGISTGPTHPIPSIVEKKMTPLPWLKTLVISSVLFCNSFNTTVLLPFVAFMVEDFGVAKSPEDVGKFSGFMLASYMAGQMIFSYPWGVAADVWGRKPSLLVGLLGSCLCTILFGFSPNFASALVLRALCGSLNGIVSITKTTLSEITDQTNQGTAFGVLGVARAIGLVVGPAVGGTLSQVHEKDSTETEGRVKKRKGPMTAWELMMDRKIALTIAIYDEVFSLWAKEPFRRGGLNFTTSDIGIVFSAGGAVLFGYQLLIYPVLERKMGSLKTFRWGIILCIPVFLLLPNVTSFGQLASPPWGDDIGNVANITAPAAFTSSFLMTANSCPSHSRGSANGVSQSFGALGRMVGPVFAGNVFSWSVGNGLGAPFDFHLTFYLLAFISVGIYMASLYVPADVDFRMEDDDEDVLETSSDEVTDETAD